MAAVDVVDPPDSAGAVHLVVRAEKGRASYDWQYSTGGRPWLSRPRTVQADATLDGVGRGAVYFFRHRAVTEEGVSDRSRSVSLLAD